MRVSHGKVVYLTVSREMTSGTALVYENRGAYRDSRTKDARAFLLKLVEDAGSKGVAAHKWDAKMFLLSWNWLVREGLVQLSVNGPQELYYHRTSKVNKKIQMNGNINTLPEIFVFELMPDVRGA
jgi:hypothetical protein